MNPFEIEMPNQDTMSIMTSEIEKLEIQVKENKKIEEKLKKLKEQLVEEIEKRDLLNWSWTTPNKIKFSYVGATEPKIEIEHRFCEGLFREAHPDLYEQYCKDFEEKKGGRKSYVRVTVPKEKI